MHFTILPRINVFDEDGNLPNAGVAVGGGDKKANLMASDTDILLCQLCGKKITNNTKRIYFYGEKEAQSFMLYHTNCFRCHVCKIQLTSRHYFTSPKKRFYCWRHYDYDGPNRHDNFMRELKSFKKYSIDKTNILFSGRFSPVKTLKTINGLCICSNEKNGYWLECTDEACRFFNNYVKSRDDKHYQVPAWYKEKYHDDSDSVEHCEEEIYEVCFHNQRHSNFYAVDQRIGPIVLSLKHETLNKHQHYRILLRSASHITEGVVPVSSFCSPAYDDNAVLDVIAKELDISSPFRPFNDAIPPSKLLLLDKVMLKSEFKVGVLFVDEGQPREEQFFTNSEHSIEFENFLSVLGDKVKLTGFKGYNGGLDTGNGLTGEYSIYKEWDKYKIMFHVSTMLPMKEHDDQKLQRKRHIGNDIVCLVFLAPGAKFDPSSIKSNFLHVFIIIETQTVNGEIYYKVNVASRDFVLHYGPPLVLSQLFKKGEGFQRWLYSKIINGERASYRSPKFAAMQERTRKQLLEEIVHDQACKEAQPLKFGRNPFQRFLPLRTSFTRSSTAPSSTPTLQRSTSFSVENGFGSATDQLRRDLKRSLANGISQYHDVLFLVGQESGGSVPAVRALLAMKSKVFNEMFFPGTPQASRRRTSVLSRVSPHYLQQHFKSNKRFTDIWKKNQQLTMREEEDGTNNNPTPLLGASPSSSIGDVREGHVPPSELHITEFNMDEFASLIEFIQTGSCVIHAQIVAGLACAAEYYEINDLRDHCIRCCSDLVNPHTACFMLTSIRTFALRYEVADRIEEIILSYIEENGADVFSCFDMSSLSDDTFSLILSLNLMLSELDKFKVIKKWHDRISTLGSPDDESDHLKSSLLAHIDFSKMTVDEIREISSFFSNDEELTDMWKIKCE